MICPRCKKDVKKITDDHIIPRLFFELADYYKVKLPYKADDPRNLQKMCPECNGNKGAKLEGKDAEKFLVLLRKGMVVFEQKGGYVPSKHRFAWRRFMPLDVKV